MISNAELEQVLRPRTDKRVPWQTALLGVAQAADISVPRIVGRERAPSVSRARQLAYFVLRVDSGLSWPEIGERMGRHHTSVLYGARRVALKLGAGDADTLAALAEARRRAV